MKLVCVVVICKMQGANSVVYYYPDTVLKVVTYDQRPDDYEELPLDVAASREAYLMNLARIKYPYIPQVYSVAGPAIYMQRVHGDVITEYIKTHPTRKNYRFLLKKVEEMSKILLSAGVRHGDLSPNNMIMLNNNIWVLDFGMATEIHSGDLDKINDIDVSVFEDLIIDFLHDEGLESIMF